MTKRIIYFRADASASIGYGHFVRTLALADMLKDDFFCVFFTSSPTEYMVSEMEKVCDFVALSKETQFEDFLSYLTGDEIVVLDNYFFTPKYQLQVKQKGCKLVCIDDMHDKHYYADIVINHATGLNRSSYDLETYTQLCTGLNWSLLRKEFINSSINTSSDKKDIFVCFGGSDFCNITTKVLEAITSRDYTCNVHVVLGEANLQREYLLTKYSNTNISFYNSLNAAEMVNIMSQCKLGILPASGLLWETLCLGMPSIFGYYVDNQIDICRNNPTLEQSVCIGDFRTIQTDELSAKISDLYKKIRTEKKQFQRNIKTNYIQLFKNTLTCRRAEEKDCDLYFEWANDPVTRSMAFKMDQIPYESHCKWFSRKIMATDTIMYLFFAGLTPVGQVRFDIDGNNAEIDISIDKNNRGKHYGTQMLQQAVFFLSLDAPGVLPVSEVLIDNIASQRIFEKCGFLKVSETDKIYKYEFHHSI